MNIRNVGDSISTAARSVRDYTKPRPSTTGDLPASSSASAAIAGAFQGWISGGPVIAGSGLLGGYVGVKVGEKSQSFLLAQGAGALTGAAVATTATVALSTLFSAPIALTNLAAGAMIGGFAGAVGTLSGSLRASTRDGVYGGMILGVIGRVVTGNPLLTIAGAAGGGIGGKAPTVAGRIVLGGLAGAATGAISGVFGGPPLMISSALIGAALGAGGAVAGPVMRQVQRNMTEDLTRALINKIDPYVQKHGISRGQKIALGATAGVLTLGPLGLLFGLKGVAVAAGAGAIIGAASTWRMLHKRDQARQQQANGAPQATAASAPAQAAPQSPAPAPQAPAPQASAPQASAPQTSAPQTSAEQPATPDPQRPGHPAMDVRRMTPEEIGAAWAEGRLPVGGPPR